MNVQILKPFLEYTPLLITLFFFLTITYRYFKIRNKLVDKGISVDMIESTLQDMVLHIPLDKLNECTHNQANQKHLLIDEIMKNEHNKQKVIIFIDSDALINKADMFFNSIIVIPGIFLLSCFLGALLYQFRDPQHMVQLTVFVITLGIVGLVLQEFTYYFFMKQKIRLDYVMADN